MKDELPTTLTMLRNKTGKAETTGISNDDIFHFLEIDETLRGAVDFAEEAFAALDEDERELLKRPETELTGILQKDFVNFYPANTRSPFVPIAARGPWIITAYGAVLHDSAGYGMLGLGHGNKELLDTLSRPRTMANVMTPQFSQKRFAKLLKKEIGHTRKSCPYSHFICMNSGSESVSVASRIVDIHTRNHIGDGGRHEHKPVRRLTLEGSFHGRTYRAARVSDSTADMYQKTLASFSNMDDLLTVPPNNIDALKTIFRKAEDDGFFIEACYFEPVMGEGVPGLALTREFYDTARELTREHGSILIMDSIQAAIRAQGCLSIVDYPGFEDCDAPDCETYSKALNAGQYPLSVLALSDDLAEMYIPGVYGNTMTTNPRALEIGCDVLSNMSETLRVHIREKGEEFIQKAEKISEELPGTISEINGTGLMVNIELDPEKLPVVADKNGVEHALRIAGINMIHGGKNGIRLTPHFHISSDEIDLIMKTIQNTLQSLT